MFGCGVEAARPYERARAKTRVRAWVPEGVFPLGSAGGCSSEHICARVGGARKLTRAVQTQLRQSTGPATSGRGPIAGADVCALFPAARQCRWMLRKASGRAGSGVRRARGGEPGIAGGLRMSLSEGERDSLWDQIEDLQEKMQTAVDQVARESVCACAHARSA